MTGLVVESATSHVEVLVRGHDGANLAHEVEEVGHGHTQRLTPLLATALDRAGVRAADLDWVAADLGPGSFTGVRVGLATVHGLAAAGSARVLGASSLAALALSTQERRALIVPLVPGGRRDLYAGFFRADARGSIWLVAAPQVGPLDSLLPRVAEARDVTRSQRICFVGPGAAREREALEAFAAGSTALERRHEGLSALDLAAAVESGRGPAAGLPSAREMLRPLYVRPAQAEERVRRRALAQDPLVLRPLAHSDIPPIADIERQVFTDPWPESFFAGELEQSQVYARVAEREGRIIGYSLAWLSAVEGHLGNLAVVPERRRRGVARRLVEDLLARAQALAVRTLTLEVRVSNFAAQALYRAHGFRLAGLRRGYYRDTGEDALVMEWRLPNVL
ncbi:MAG TPA: ribosomal protein S18-alanine N-acetyltransferase [Candidatus Limnocylindria bacterium]|nr:ribosomal protein S18-alanine N-acetyltransferase [Candidatus Limnocylindria bacterium]